MGRRVNSLEIKNVEDKIYKEICDVVKRQMLSKYKKTGK